MSEAPLPPIELARRVGVVDQDDPLGSFDAMGADIKRFVLDAVGHDWFSEPRSMLDFGCGSGKLLRHFLKEAEQHEIYGCDIDEPSVGWLNENLSPPLRVFTCSEEPGLDLPEGHLDLALAMSVFTHLTDHWAGWLLELHRVLKPGGRLIATFLGRGMSPSIASEEWDADRVGMNVLRAWQPWEHGGPSVQHSEWWLRAHWGRLFDFERVEDSDEAAHGWLLLRKRGVSVSKADLEAIEPDEPREFTALRHNVAQLCAETVALARDRDLHSAERQALSEERDRVLAELRRVQVGPQRLGSSAASRLRNRVRRIVRRLRSAVIDADS
jgi:SAM-dependent methyltransferase